MEYLKKVSILIIKLPACVQRKFNYHVTTFFPEEFPLYFLFYFLIFRSFVSFEVPKVISGGVWVQSSLTVAGHRA